MSAYNFVVDTIKQEHRVLGHVVQVLQHTLRDIAAEHSEVDFSLLSGIEMAGYSCGFRGERRSDGLPQCSHRVPKPLSPHPEPASPKAALSRD